MKVDVIAIDTAHGHSQRVMNAVKSDRKPLSGGAVDYRQCRYLRRRTRVNRLGVDGIKVGIGPGSICTTRVVSRSRRAADHCHFGMRRKPLAKPACP